MSTQRYVRDTWALSTTPRLYSVSSCRNARASSMREHSEHARHRARSHQSLSLLTLLLLPELVSSAFTPQLLHHTILHGISIDFPSLFVSGKIPQLHLLTIPDQCPSFGKWNSACCTLHPLWIISVTGKRKLHIRQQYYSAHQGNSPSARGLLHAPSRLHFHQLYLQIKINNSCFIYFISSSYLTDHSHVLLHVLKKQFVLTHPWITRSLHLLFFPAYSFLDRD